MTFRELWLDSVARKNSVLCAGLDPAEYALGRGEKGLSKGVDKIKWTLDFMETVAPFVAAFKPNLQYWLTEGEREGLTDSKITSSDLEHLSYIVELARELETPVILDAKIADIGSTSQAGVWAAATKGFDAVTVAPYAGNMEEFAEFGKAHDIGIITMCLMSNPHYRREKNKLVEIIPGDNYHEQNIIKCPGVGVFVRQYTHLAHDAKRFGIDGIVIGAPSDKNHVTPEEIANTHLYAGNNTLVLMPGVGAQGGEAQEIWQHYGTRNVIVNASRGVMFPQQTRRDLWVDAWRDAAKMYRDMLNEHRDAA
ncbi:hypothetical protein GOV07_01095 [Candidatus Woesearchaeota archaeon]|nr:hypothetical protein [Candidatus Woesearchaeota archaeon]